MDPLARQAMRTAGRVSAIGMEFAGAVIVCLLIGYWADGKLGTTPWLGVVGLILGSIIGFKAIHRVAKQMQRDAEADAARETKSRDTPDGDAP